MTMEKYLKVYYLFLLQNKNLKLKPELEFFLLVMLLKLIMHYVNCYERFNFLIISLSVSEKI